MPYLFRLLLLMLASSAALAEETNDDWQFPWPKGYLPMTSEVSKETIDGYDARTQLWLGQGITIGLPLATDWLFRETKEASFRLAYRYGAGIDCRVYCYPGTAYAQSNEPEQFTAYIESIAKDASEDKTADVAFVRNEAGDIRIEPERIVNKRSLLYNPNATEPQGVLPRIMGEHFYEVQYTCLREGRDRQGVLLFVFLKGFVFGVQLEASPADFARGQQQILNLLEEAYVDGQSEPEPESQG